MGSVPREPGEFVDEVGSGDYRRGLEALRDQLADSLAAAPVTVRPQYAGQLRAVLKELADIPAPKRESKSDELAHRRAARRAAAQAAAATATENLERGGGSS